MFSFGTLWEEDERLRGGEEENGGEERTGAEGKEWKAGEEKYKGDVRVKVIVIISFWEVRKRSKGRLVLKERKEVKGKANAAVKREMCKVVSLPQGHTVHV